MGRSTINGQQPEPLLDHGYGPKPPEKPLQFKRGTAKAFWVKNPILLAGQPAIELDTNRLKVGDGKTKYNKLPYIGEGKDGKSAYELWIESGYSGTIDDFLEFCIGPDGKSAYEIWLSLGHEGTITDFMDSLKGDDAYEVWKKEMGLPEATVQDFLDYLCSDTWGPFE